MGTEIISTDLNKTLEGLLKDKIESRLQEIALEKAELMAAQYSEFLKTQFASIATSAAIHLFNQISLHRNGHELLISLAVEDFKNKL